MPEHYVVYYIILHYMILDSRHCHHAVSLCIMSSCDVIVRRATIRCAHVVAHSVPLRIG